MKISEEIRAAVTLILDRMQSDLDRDTCLKGIRLDIRLNPMTNRPTEIKVTRYNHEELPGRRSPA